MRRQRVCIIAFKQVSQCIHVLRQIDYLSARFDLDVIGYGEADPAWPELRWHAVPEPNVLSKLMRGLLYLGGRVAPFLYDVWFWTATRHREAYTYALQSGADAIHANDWQALPIAIAVARQTGARVVFHTHEYAEEERDDSVLWRLLVAPAVRYLLRKYATNAKTEIAACITVCAPIAHRYERELGLKVDVVFNAPVPARPGAQALTDEPSPAPPGGSPVRLIHHGYAKRGRGLHKLIEALALTDERFVLDFMLVEDDGGYIDELQALAARLAPGRVRFRAPVAPAEIVETVAAYDVGFCVIEPTTYNNLNMLPNKFFEYVQAGLMVCIGPSPAMVDLVDQYGFGVTAASFEPKDVAATLNALTPGALAAMKSAARRAASVLNADVEMGKIVALYERVLEGMPQVVTR